MKGEQTDDGI